MFYIGSVLSNFETDKTSSLYIIIVTSDLENPIHQFSWKSKLIQTLNGHIESAILHFENLIEFVISNLQNPCIQILRKIKAWSLYRHFEFRKSGTARSWSATLKTPHINFGAKFNVWYRIRHFEFRDWYSNIVISYLEDLNPHQCLRGQAWVKMMKKSNLFNCIFSLKISSKICSLNPFIEIRFRFLLWIKNVKRKKSNFRENFVVTSKICRTLCSVENNH